MTVRRLIPETVRARRLLAATDAEVLAAVEADLAARGKLDSGLATRRAAARDRLRAAPKPGRGAGTGRREGRRS